MMCSTRLIYHHNHNNNNNHHHHHQLLNINHLSSNHVSCSQRFLPFVFLEQELQALVLKHDSVRQARNVGLFGGSLNKWLRVGRFLSEIKAQWCPKKGHVRKRGVSINYGVQLPVSVDGVG